MAENSTHVRGAVVLEATVSGSCQVRSDKFEIAASWPTVTSVSIDLSVPTLVRLTVHFSDVPTQNEAEEVAMRVAVQMVNRLSFALDLVLRDPAVRESAFEPLNCIPGVIHVPVLCCQLVLNDNIQVIKTTALNDARIVALKTNLGLDIPPGEVNFGLFRTVLQAVDPTEQFMQLYALLLAFVGKRQAQVNSFIRQHQPGGDENVAPHTGGTEPIYTWLRNELAHFPRTTGFTLSSIRQQMLEQLPGLRRLVRLAIEQYS